MTIGQISKDRRLCRVVQDSLTRVGYLDPRLIALPNGVQNIGSDGIFGPNTENAFRAWVYDQSLLDEAVGEEYDDALINLLLDSKMVVNFEDGVASKIAKAMLDAGHYLSLNPSTFNIVYLEGVNQDWTLNDNEIDRWNDLRVLLSFDAKGTPSVIRSYVATTGPGRYYTEKPMNKDGCARIAFGQYKSWAMGLHNGKQPALRQCATILVHRDLNKDGSRDGDLLYIVPTSINQHSTSEKFEGETIGRHSAGCLVGKNYGNHLEYLDILKTDARFRDNAAYVFMSSILEGKKIFV